MSFLRVAVLVFSLFGFGKLDLFLGILVLVVIFFL